MIDSWPEFHPLALFLSTPQGCDRSSIVTRVNLREGLIT
jgi:hypothetical protein